MKVWPWLLLLAAWLAYAVPAAWRRVHAPKDPWAPWRLALGGELEEHYLYLENVFLGNAELIDEMLGSRGLPERTRESIGWGLDALTSFTQVAAMRMAEWQRIARVIDAEGLGPWPAVPARPFCLVALRRLAWRQALAQYLVSRTCDLRLAMLNRGFQLIGVSSAAVTKRLTHLAWAALLRRGACLAHDFGTLSQDALASARALLAAVERSDRPTA